MVIIMGMKIMTTDMMMMLTTNNDNGDDEVYLAKLSLNILWLRGKNHQRLSSVWIKII